MNSSIRIKFLVIFSAFFISSLLAQETHNLEVIWTGRWPASVTGVPESCQTYGMRLGSGDLNGDSLSDLVINSMPVFWVGAQDTPTSYVLIHFGRSVLDTIPDIILRAENPYDALGFSICTGDINGDGFQDLIVGAPMGSSSPPGRLPRVYVYLGPVNNNDTVPDFTLYGREGSAYAGAIACGDVNGDTYDDIIVGAYADWPGTGGYLMGRVYIYYGSPNFDTDPDVIINGGHENDREGFGFTVGSSGDVNNDGIDDIIIGASTFGQSIKGRVYIYYGGNPMDTSYDVAISGEVPNQSLGWSQKVNLIKTEFMYDWACFGSQFWPYGFPRPGPGKIYVLFGGNPMDSIPDVWMIGRGDTTGLGCSVSNAGFINQTNSEGIISGAPDDFNPFGTSYLWLGGELLDTAPDAWLRGVQNNEGVGCYVASAGDVDGDGKDEIMVSNYASTYPHLRVWVCKYTGSGIEEERLPITINRLFIKISPNPCLNYTTISFSLTAKSRVSLKIFDVSGKKVKSFDNEKNILSAGYHTIHWDLRDNKQIKLGSGIYLLEMQSEREGIKKREMRKIKVIK
jgi:hypothetical protein